MAKAYILYNPYAGDGRFEEDLQVLQIVLDRETEIHSITAITNYAAFLGGLEEEDQLILAGGDGTLNRFVNDTRGIPIRAEILYFPSGSGNDLARDLGKEPGADPFPVGAYLKALPRVEVNGEERLFLNAVGFGIDGYCCVEGDRLRQKPDKKVNYTAIAVKGLLFHYKPVRATVTVDGIMRTYDRVWLAPVMHGRFYGGGMMAAPEQDRMDPEGKLSVMVFHGCGKCKTLRIFPSIFKGNHTKFHKYVDILQGDAITVEFESARALQIDGEVVPKVKSYTARRDRVAAQEAMVSTR